MSNAFMMTIYSVLVPRIYWARGIPWMVDNTSFDSKCNSSIVVPLAVNCLKCSWIYNLYSLQKCYCMGRGHPSYWKPFILLPKEAHSSKIKVPQFPYCHYVSVYVCMYALSLQPTPFDLTSWNLNQEVDIWSCPNASSTFFKYSLFGKICPFLRF